MWFWFCIAIFAWIGLTNNKVSAAPSCQLSQREITVDGDLSDWQGIAPHVVCGKDHLRFSQRAFLDPALWEGKKDLSFQWRGAWSKNRLFFAVEVNDDIVTEPKQEVSFRCDCVEIYIDYANQGGGRVKILDGRDDWFAKCDPKELMGYEMHILAKDPPEIYLDHTDKYVLDKPQTDRFHRDWAGTAKFRKTPTGYLIEVSFEIPNVSLQDGKVIGLEVTACDDDGPGRDNIMVWTGTPLDFWLTMDDYGKATLVETQRQLLSRLNPDGTQGIAVIEAGMASAEQTKPLQLEFVDSEKGSFVRSLSGGYSSITKDQEGLDCSGRLQLDEKTSFVFKDRWQFVDKVLHLDRTVTVEGDAPGGFLSAALLQVTTPQTWPQIEWFTPGMIYGNFDLIPDFAIGGRDYYQPGAYTVRIREDRMPAPLMSAFFKDGSTLTVLNPEPKGNSTAEESMGFSFETMIDKRFQFGAVGAQEREETITLGYWFPGSEGEQAYAEKKQGVNGGQAHHRWRRRFHPIQNGLTQHYEVSFRFGQADGLNDSVFQAWRWAWQELQPKVNPQDIDAVRRCEVDVLADNIIEIDDRAGIPLALSSVANTPKKMTDARATMGFIGKSLEAAEFMLAESLLDKSERGKELRRKAEKMIDSFLRIKMNPPESEGFFIETGKYTFEKKPDETSYATIDRLPNVFLRCLCDDMKALLRAYQREKKNGYDHPEWLAWIQQFTDWLLTQQQPAGGFPRAWNMGTGEVLFESSSSSFNAVSLLLRMYRVTGDEKYRDAAIRAGEFTWNNGQKEGRFVGGTVDNADVIDKEAATISLECYLDLYDVTKEPKWIQRARVAANIAETWMYIWNIPMPEDAKANELHWNRDIPTTGLQLISSGHTLVDAYMCFDVDEYARLFRLTDDPHYLDVARILLHNTKAMVQLPDRDYGLHGPGWQQEHYSLAPPRGKGRHRHWLPWVTTSQLNGIFGLMDFDKELYNELAK